MNCIANWGTRAERLRQACQVWYSSVPLSSLPTVSSAPRSLPITPAEFFARLSVLQADSPPNARTLSVALLGAPNSGKSSLVNMLINWRVCAVSQRINTTRSKQNAVLTLDNTQLVFVDLPGVKARDKHVRDKNLELSLVRDPHSGIFAADLILVIVDVTHPPSRLELDREVLKALHFFCAKPAALVLNKVDKVTRARTVLLDVIRHLTDGVVAGGTWHRDRYYRRMAQTLPTSVLPLLNSPRSQELLKRHRQQRSDLLDEPLSLTQSLSEHFVAPITDLQEHLTFDYGHTETTYAVKQLPKFPAVPVCSPGASEQQPAVVVCSPCASEQQPAVSVCSPGASEQQSTLPVVPVSSQDAMEDEDLMRELAVESKTEPFLAALREQLLLRSVTPQQAFERRAEWRKISNLVQHKTTWRNFMEVFFVSGATGEGVAQLRDWLIEQAHPGLWPYHSSLATDMEPHDVMRATVWSWVLEALPGDSPYKIKPHLESWERTACGKLYLEISLICGSERDMAAVLGLGGQRISFIARNAEKDLMEVFQTSVHLKVAVKSKKIPTSRLKSIRTANKFSDIYHDNSSLG